MNPFETVKSIYTGEKVRLQNQFMVNKIFSYMPETFLLSTQINNYIHKLPSWAILGIYKAGITTRKPAPFIPYEKAVKVESPQLVKKISAHLCCSTTHALQTIELLRLQGYKPESFFGLKKDK